MWRAIMPDVELPAGVAGATVMLVDDDALLVETLAANLSNAGLNAVPVVGGKAALDYLGANPGVDAMILDWQMPDIDGPTVLERARAMGVTAPAIFLTGLNQPIYEERGLALGAVDYVEKSKSFAIIMHRLRLALSGAKGGVATPTSTSFGALELHGDSARAVWRGEAVPLTLSEFRVVQLLATKNGGDVTYRAIYDVVRGEGFQAGSGEEGFRANVRALVKRVRQKFRDVDPTFEALENYPGFGYRWRAEN
jgi:two-component system response regulator ChvI